MTTEEAFAEAVRLLEAEAGKPDFIRIGDVPHAVFAVCGFLRWGAEPFYSLNDWRNECDMFLVEDP